MAQTVKRLPTIQEIWIQFLGQEDLLEKQMATCFSILAWKIPWMEEPGRLQSMGLQRVRHDWVISPHFISSYNTLDIVSHSIILLKLPCWRIFITKNLLFLEFLTFFLVSLTHNSGDWKSEIKEPACSGSGAISLWDCRLPISSCILTLPKESWVFFLFLLGP